jgi:uncharacterized protein (DUF2236 family)
MDGVGVTVPVHALNPDTFFWAHATFLEGHDHRTRADRVPAV